MEEIMLNFFNLRGVSPDWASIRLFSRIISFRINDIRTAATKEGITFDDLFAHCASHELIHQILFDDYGYDMSVKFDWVCYTKYKKFKHWIGGVGGGP